MGSWFSIDILHSTLYCVCSVYVCFRTLYSVVCRVLFGEFSLKYELGKKLGEGGFGTVYECTNRETKEKYAVKRIDIDHKKDILNVAKKEEEICVRLEHENIVVFHESLREETWFFMVFELVRGDELLRAIGQRTHYSERDATNFMYQIFNAVEYCHDKNIIHRDLTPYNIMLRTQDDRIKLIDFGLAKVIDGNAINMYGYTGTLDYMAPEMVWRQAYGKPVDIWACGVLFYILLSGDHPFSAPKDEMIKTCKYTFPRKKFQDITTDSVHFIKSIMRRVQSDRPTANEAILRILQLNDRTDERIDKNLPEKIRRLGQWS